MYEQGFQKHARFLKFLKSILLHYNCEWLRNFFHQQKIWRLFWFAILINIQVHIKQYSVFTKNCVFFPQEFSILTPLPRHHPRAWKMAGQ